MAEKHFIIGIDLGTTNSAVSWVDISGSSVSRNDISIYDIPQLTNPGELSRQKILPSCLYIPGEHEIKKEDMFLPWNEDPAGIVGAFARDQGSKVPARMVVSAKSWLCYGKVDRRAPVLPWSSGGDIKKVSPVTATASYLSHIKESWNHSMKDNEDLYLENQDVIITVPASFDEIARDLTVEAAAIAGIKNITLLEEPLAAFYNWLIVHEKDWDQYVRPGDLILVCDVGGGTTDFTLITLRDLNGNPVFDRIAVGDHLILGGDNMDLALARIAESRFQTDRKGSLNINRWQALCHQCRKVKEDILGGKRESRNVTLTGEGRRLIADTLTTVFNASEVEDLVVNGFFPFVDPDDPLKENVRQGMTELGLPYAQDPAITRHMLRFLDQHRDDVKDVLGREIPKPDLILFNGAALKPEIIRERIRESVRCRFNEKDHTLPGILVNSELDLAVAMGASYYGLVKRGIGVRVGSGSPRSYYLGIERPEKDRIEPDPGDYAICLVERGMEEGTGIDLEGRSFQVLANQPVSFDLYSSSFRSRDRTGDLVKVDDTLSRLSPINTVIQFGKKAKRVSLPVKIEASYTEMGTLALWCCSLQSEHRWRLQFQLRDSEKTSRIADSRIFDEMVVNQAVSHVKDVFLKKNPDMELVNLVKDLEKMLEFPRDRWPLSFIRVLADEVLLLDHVRRYGAQHESRWLNLAGFCLRPGFGDDLDEHRMKKLWKLYHYGPINQNREQVLSDWWVLWRRTAGGLTAGQQRQVLQGILPSIKPGKNGVKTKLASQEHMEVWMAIANMERLSVKDKIDCGRLLVEYLTPKRNRPQYWWALSRIGSREPLYGTVDRVIPGKEVESWISAILQKKWKNPRVVGQAISQMARLTGDRKRDLSHECVGRIVDWMKPEEWSGPYIRLLEEIVHLDRQEETSLFGESIPSGIILHRDAGDKDSDAPGRVKVNNE